MKIFYDTEVHRLSCDLELKEGICIFFHEKFQIWRPFSFLFFQGQMTAAVCQLAYFFQANILKSVP